MMTGYEALSTIPSSRPAPLTFSPNPAYEQYLKMHKVLVGRRGAGQLVEIHNSLAQEMMPRYLSAAGWAATEAAVVDSGMTPHRRSDLIESGVACWDRALATQQQINLTGPETIREDAYPQRIALDIACAPLFQGVVGGKIPKKVRKSVFEDCVNVAEANSIQLHLASQAGDQQAVGAHYGLGFECNAVLAYNLPLMADSFAAPSSARSDTGYHHPSQTHDIQVVQHSGGRVEGITPLEIKSAASARDRRRFLALLVRGKMHLSAVGHYAPADTLDAITAQYSGTATSEQQQIGQTVQDSLHNMIGLYSAGEPVSTVRSRTVTVFRNSDLAADAYGGIRRVS